MQLVEKHKFNTKNKYFNLLDNFCFLSKNLYNYANYKIRQGFIITSKLKENKELREDEKLFLEELNKKVDEYNIHKFEVYNKKLEKEKQEELENAKEEIKEELENTKEDVKKAKKKKLKEPNLLKHFGKDNKYISYYFNDFLSKGEDYANLPFASCSQQILRLLEKNWKSFFESIRDYSKNPSKYKSRPKLPKYKDKSKGRNILIISKPSFKLNNGIISFSDKFKGFTIKTKAENICQIRIISKNNQIVVEVVYEVSDIALKNEDINKVLSIDLGVNNLATIVNNIGEKPIVIDGKNLKSKNQYYNKKISYYKSLAKKLNDKNYTKRMYNLTNKRNNQVEDILHKASKYIVEYANKMNVDTIIIGYNNDKRFHLLARVKS